DRGVSFDELGVYRLLAQVDDVEGVERFAKDWLGRLIDYDNRRRSDLVLTLSRYLESGGNYEAAAAELSMHRSTVKYRVQRIKEISGHDLADPDTRFNLQLATRVWYTLLAVGRHDAAAPSTAQ
ncbi:MAG: helix-turn-helix domain-containing protein, partial [Actinobacteria bacterium]|nr:helix-turn-helix domain-containing protein [Actinomycetota bacterium]